MNSNISYILRKIAKTSFTVMKHLSKDWTTTSYTSIERKWTWLLEISVLRD